ncbi:MAG TPA: hypothetical protein VNO54_12260 [Streptosporangiaceae bacterium]|nr:hypothetical protein [Streptosporangiaceae bacterium]
MGAANDPDEVTRVAVLGTAALSALSRRWRATVDAGHGQDDISAARLGLANTARGDQV